MISGGSRSKNKLNGIQWASPSRCYGYLSSAFYIILYIIYFTVVGETIPFVESKQWSENDNLTLDLVSTTGWFSVMWIDVSFRSLNRLLVPFQECWARNCSTTSRLTATGCVLVPLQYRIVASSVLGGPDLLQKEGAIGEERGWWFYFNNLTVESWCFLLNMTFDHVPVIPGTRYIPGSNH